MLRRRDRFRGRRLRYRSWTLVQRIYEPDGGSHDRDFHAGSRLSASTVNLDSLRDYQAGHRNISYTVLAYHRQKSIAHLPASGIQALPSYHRFAPSPLPASKVSRNSREASGATKC